MREIGQKVCMQATVKYLSDTQIENLKDQILDTYRLAFGEAPYNKTEADVISFSQALDLHRNRLGARFLAAHDINNGLVGFAYGYQAVPGQWWYDMVEKSMTIDQVQEWLVGAFELVELAVRPSAQGFGIGGSLHNTILSGLTNRTAVLSTITTDTVAQRMYRKRGWTPLLDNFTFPTSIHSYLIMGLKLPFKKVPAE
jgi:GNAT superfamily N-acetyltransferase